MKHLHNVVISVFAREHEDISQIREKLASLVPFGMEQEKVQVKQQTAMGFKDKKIKIFEIRLDKERHLKKFLEFLVGMLSEKQKEMLASQKESRLDEKLDFFIRLDKQKWLDGGAFITDSGDCFHIKMSIAAFPAKREAALAVIDKIFK